MKRESKLTGLTPSLAILWAGVARRDLHRYASKVLSAVALSLRQPFHQDPLPHKYVGKEQMKRANIYSEIAYKEDKPAIQVLFKTGFTKEIRIVFKKGQAMKEHKTSYPIVVEVCEGQVDFGLGDKILHLVRGDILALEPSVPHDLLATEDCIVRLTLTMSDTAKRVKEVVAGAG